MRWQELFADLEGQARSLESADRESEIADRTRGEVAQVGLGDRLVASLGRSVALVVWGVGSVQGVLDGVGPDWMLLRSGGVGPNISETVMPLKAVTALLDLPEAAVAAAAIGPVQARTRLPSVLRAVARDRSVVSLHLRDGGRFVGTPGRVGANFLDLAVHDSDVSPRASSLRGHVTVPFSALAMVQRRESGWG